MQVVWHGGWRQIVRHGLPSVLISGGAPLVAYCLLRPHLPELQALLITLMIPLAENGIALLRHRRLSVFSLLVAASLLLGAVLALVSGSPRLLLARESFLSGAFGAAMLLSLFAPQPLVYYMAGHFLAGHDKARLRDYKRKGRTPWLRSFFRLLTAVWGCITLGDSLLNMYLAFHLSIPSYLLVTPLARYGVMALALAWTLAHAHRGRYITHLLPAQMAVA